MRILIACTLLLVMLNTAAQDSLARPKSQPINEISTVRGEDLRRFPSSNFLDAVNGLFPWVFSENQDANQFLFIVDGFISFDINAISLNDLEEISFSRNINGDFYPSSRPGTFYIRTKTPQRHKPTITFNTQYNVSWNKRQRMFYGDAYGAEPTANGQTLINNSENGSGHFTSNHLSLGSGNQRFHVYSSLQWDDVSSPSIRQDARMVSPVPDTSTGWVTSKLSDIKAFLGLGYRVSKKLQIGFNGNYIHGRSKVASDYVFKTPNVQLLQQYSEPEKLSQIRLGGFLKWQPLNHLRNNIYVEYLNNRLDYDRNSQATSQQYNGVPPDYYLVTSDNRSSVWNYTLRNHLEYDLPLKGKFKGGVGAWFSYTNGKVSLNQFAIQQTGSGIPGNPSIFSTTSKYKTRTTSINPQLYFSFDSVINVNAGFGLLLNKGVSKYNSRSRSNPYIDVSIDLRRALPVSKGISRLEIQGHYADLTRNEFSTYWAPSINNPETFFFGGPLTPIIFGSTPIFLPNSSLNDVLLKNRLSSVRLEAGFLDNRFLAGVEWSNLQSQTIFLLPIYGPVPDPSYVPVLGKETRSGFSMFAAATVFRKGENQWSSRINALLPHVKDELEGHSSFNDLLKPSKSSLELGWQNSLRFGNWSFQMNALLGIDRTYYNTSYVIVTTTEKKADEIRLNYLSIGYDLKMPNSGAMQGITLFAHGRNILGSAATAQFFQYDSYAGIGMNVRFK